MFKKNRDYGSEVAEEDFLDDDECLSAETECLSVEDGDLLDDEEEVCVSDVDEAEDVADEVAGEVGADTVVGEVVAGVDFVDDDLAGETAPL